jgi:integrase
MSVLIRCKKCQSYYSTNLKQCKRCGTADKVKSFYVQYSNNGKRKIVFVGYSLSKAKELDSKYRYKLVKDKTQIMTFSEYIDNYYILNFKQGKSWKSRIGMLNRLVEILKDDPIDRITPARTERAVLSLTGGGEGACYFNAYIALIHRVFEYAVEIELLDKNPVKMAKNGEDRTRKRFLNEKERFAFIEACKLSRSPCLLQMVYIALLAGLRLGEIRNLRKEDVRDGCIYIRSEVTKSKRGRAIPMNEELAAVMDKATFNYNRYIEYAFEKAVSRSGLEDVHFHDLRRTFGSMLAQAGVPIFDISKLMGHSNVNITARIYAHLLPENLKSAVGKIKL